MSKFLAAIDRKRHRVFVLSVPDLSAVKVEGKWYYCYPLIDRELKNYDLITNLTEASKMVQEAKLALNLR